MHACTCIPPKRAGGLLLYSIECPNIFTADKELFTTFFLHIVGSSLLEHTTFLE